MLPDAPACLLGCSCLLPGMLLRCSCLPPGMLLPASWEPPVCLLRCSASRVSVFLLFKGFRGFPVQGFPFFRCSGVATASLCPAVLGGRLLAVSYLRENRPACAGCCSARPLDLPPSCSAGASWRADFWSRLFSWARLLGASCAVPWPPPTGSVLVVP